jgi:hypothetical protein
MSLILIFFYLSIANVAAQSELSNTEGQEAHNGKTHHEMNHVAVFAGGTAMLEKNDINFSLGLDYLRILTESRDWGAGGFAEVIFAKHNEWLFGGLIYYRIKNQFFIRTGPGIEIIKHEETDPVSGQTHLKSQTELLYRIGVGYSHHIKNMIISPTIDLDLVRSADALVFGLNIGWAF